VSPLDSLLPKLHQRTIVSWQSEMDAGKPIYDGLVALLRAKRYARQITPGALTKHQVANALVVIFRLRRCGVGEEVFAIIEDALSHDEVRVRDQAITLYIGMMRLNGWQEPYYTERTKDVVRWAIIRGLHGDAEKHATQLLVQGPSAFSDLYGFEFGQ
jgi:hypothetical protein